MPKKRKTARAKSTGILPLCWMPLILCLAGLAFSPVLSAGFLRWDDTTHLLYNPFVYNLSMANLAGIFTHTVNNTYVPLTVLSFGVEHHFFGLNPFVFHLNNLLFHLLNTWLVQRVCLQLGLPRRAALLAAVLFAVHPLRVESVAWITERKDVLYAFFYLSALSFYLHYLKNKSWRPYLAGLVCGLLSVLAKPMAVSLALILFLLDWISQRPKSRRMLWDKIPFLLVTVPLAAVTVSSLGFHLAFDFPVSLHYFVWTFAFYLKKFFFPLHLFPMYVPELPARLMNPEYSFAWITFLAFWGGVWIFRRQRWFVFGCLFYAGSIFFLWRLGTTDTNFTADRFMYLPGLGLSIWIAGLLDQGLGTVQKKAGGRQRLAWMIVVILIAGLGAKTYFQSRLWRSDESLWAYTLKHQPHNPLAQKKRLELEEDLPRSRFDFSRYDQWLAHQPGDPRAFLKRGQELARNAHFYLAFQDFNRAVSLDSGLAEAYLERGRLYLLRQDFNLALQDFETVIRLNPSDAPAYLNKAQALSFLKRLPESLETIQLAMTLDPASASAYFHRAKLYAQQHQLDLAMADDTRALQLTPGFIDALKHRAQCHLNLERAEDALADYLKIVELHPRDYTALNEVGLLYLKKKEFVLAESHFSKALAANPYFKRAYNNRGALRVRQGEYRLALEDFLQAIRLEPTDYKLFITRGDIYFVMGHLSRAQADFERAIFLEPGQGVGYYKRSHVFRKRGNARRAQADLRKAQALGWH